MSLSARDAGIQALKTGNAAAAIEHLQRAVQENPQDGQSHGYLGLAYGQARQFEKAAASPDNSLSVAQGLPAAQHFSQVLEGRW